jgi:hypothetical protein
MNNTPMSKPAVSLVVYGVYVILGLALPFLLIPGPVLSVVGMAQPTDVWVRVVGMTALILGFYYIQIGRNELMQFMRYSVYTRASVPVFFIIFVLLGFAPPVMIALAIPDVLFTIWTAVVLRGQKPSPVTA